MFMKSENEPFKVESTATKDWQDLVGTSNCYFGRFCDHTAFYCSYGKSRQIFVIVSQNDSLLFPRFLAVIR